MAVSSTSRVLKRGRRIPSMRRPPADEGIAQKL
jgi:hypothetical protein